MTDSNPSPSIREIAKAAGVSPMTVSRALRDSPLQKAATRDRIQRIARELGYKPHPYVTALMSGLRRAQRQAVTVNLAVLHFDTCAQTRQHAFYRGIDKRARDLGYIAECVHYEPDRIAPPRLRDILLSRGIRGIIVMPAPQGFASVDFDFNGFAAATLGQTIVNPPLPRIASDSYNGTFQVLEKLVQRGYKRIGLVSTQRINELARFLYSAATIAYRNHVSPEIHLVEYTIADSALTAAETKNLKRWIQDEHLDCIICPAFDLPLYDILLRQGFKIPGKLGYVHLLPYPKPHVTSLVQMGEWVGAKAVDVVTAMINRNELSPPKFPPNRLHPRGLARRRNRSAIGPCRRGIANTALTRSCMIFC